MPFSAHPKPRETQTLRQRFCSPQVVSASPRSTCSMMISESHLAAIRAKIYCLGALLLSAHCVGCAPYMVNTYHDKFDGYTKNTMQLNWVSYELYGAMIELNAQRLVPKVGRASYQLIVVYYDSGYDRGGEWLFIKAGESLILLVDGERIGLRTSENLIKREVGYGGSITETAFYLVPVEVLLKLANAKRVEVKIVGRHYFVTRHFRGGNIANFRRFCKNYVADHESKTRTEAVLTQQQDSAIDGVAVAPNCPRDQIDRLIDQLATFKVTALARELQKDLHNTDYTSIKQSTRETLSWWCQRHAGRQRERAVRPIALRINSLLFSGLDSQDPEGNE